MSRWFRSTVILVSTSAALCGGAVAVAHQPVARAAGSCGVGSGHGYGYTYLDTLSVYRTSCANGRTIAKHHGHVSGWHCSKSRLSTSPFQYLEHEKCTSGSRRVSWTYTQNT